MVKSEGSVSIEDLLKEFDVSRITIWKDLKLLEDQGFLARVHGGAMRLDKLNPEEEEFPLRKETSSKEKKKIAQHAAKNYVKDDQILFLDGGTTVLEMLSHLNYNNLTILTNGLFTLMKATNYVPELNLICLGGVFRKPSFTFVGPDVEEYISKYHVDIAFVSAYGVTLEKGLMDPNPLDMEVKKFLCQNAKKIVVLIDSEKIGKSSLTPFLKLEDIHHLITDDGTSSEFIEELKKLNVEVDVVSI